ncbi:MAG: hydrophobin family protein [Nitrososphaeraceae archaeon]
MNNKFTLLKKSSTILLAAVLVVGFIGLSTPSSIFAQNYNDDYESEYSQYNDDDYEKSYEKYMKDDNSKTSIKNIKINCDNSNYNPPITVNLDNSGPTNGEAGSLSDTSRSFSNGDSQSGQDRMNADKKGKFTHICQNNNNVNVDINAESTTNIDTLQQIICNDNNFNGLIVIGCTNIDVNTLDLGDPITTADDTISSSSNDNTEQPSVQSQSIIGKNLHGMDIQQHGNQQIDIQQIKSLNNVNGMNIQQQTTGDPTELTVQEKLTKLKAQWLNQLH